ncbi:glycosyltransferase [Aquimarina sp. ERC-38]|uniref:glycosyltransferase n=1 Tax=Aquimarina sp. ERC-38 TaxID=2949996 RepID=UPI0022474865|nr:glycosyltransferase [Aquimarina sp. ERC-38]UZO79372.1 glycosyltransferase [Aquimarina sp. ERC-38]
MYFSFIIPVYNRPEEIDELLESMSYLQYNEPFEVVIVEDGSTLASDQVIANYNDTLAISYYVKKNTGPGDSRNYGMQKARGEYFLILDSDVILPSNYLLEVASFLKKEYVSCFGGPDDAHADFTALQKAINYSMTSYLTTGGIRGKKKVVDKFQPRSFNMGLSKEAFLASQGFGNIHPGEDPDLTIRLWKLGYHTAFIPEAKVFHKRRISWKKFFQQVKKFGLVRPILTKWHPETSKITYWFPSVFILCSIVALVLLLFGVQFPVYVLLLYIIGIFIEATLKNNSVRIGSLAIIAVGIQFYGYGTGFLQSYFKIHLLHKNPETTFPKLFFRKK